MTDVANCSRCLPVKDMHSDEVGSFFGGSVN